MNKYKEIVISIIKQDGNEVVLPSSKKDYKHINAFNRLIVEDDSFNLRPFLEANSQNITGFDVSKYLSANGNIVFFQTDVHNTYNNILIASVIIPNEMTEIQKEKLKELLDTLAKEGFEIYLGKALRKKRKVIYQKICYDDYREERKKNYVKK